MIIFEETEVIGWRHAIRGMRNSTNSWEKSDSLFCERNDCETCEFNDDCCAYKLSFDIGSNDHELMLKLAKAGSIHAKYRRMITVYVDITAPLYWWKEFDTYKVGTVTNSCSTMHKIHDKEFTVDDFSCEHLRVAGKNNLLKTIDCLNSEREAFIGKGLASCKGDKQCWYSMIQLLPSSYNQKRTVMFNYEVLSNIYISRKNHKLDEWQDFCKWVEGLSYSEFITCNDRKEAHNNDR